MLYKILSLLPLLLLKTPYIMVKCNEILIMSTLSGTGGGKSPIYLLPIPEKSYLVQPFPPIISRSKPSGVSVVNVDLTGPLPSTRLGFVPMEANRLRE
jgi:hypothetical protein